MLLWFQSLASFPQIIPEPIVIWFVARIYLYRKAAAPRSIAAANGAWTLAPAFEFGAAVVAAACEVVEADDRVVLAAADVLDTAAEERVVVMDPVVVVAAADEAEAEEPDVLAEPVGLAVPNEPVPEALAMEKGGAKLIWDVSSLLMISKV